MVWTTNQRKGSAQTPWRTLWRAIMQSRP